VNKTTSKILITLPESPYRILGVAFDADSRAINQAMRALFRKDPRNGAVKGNRAQKQLTDPRERIKEDALVLETDLPLVDLAPMETRIRETAEIDRCRPLEDLILFSDLHCAPERLIPRVQSRDLPVSVPFRETHDKRPAPWDAED